MCAVRLEQIARSNFDAIADLALHSHQRSWVASNSYSVAQASFNPALRCLAIYSQEQPVGFLMYCMPEESDEHPGEYAVWRLMIDAKHQQHGYGKAALKLLLALIWSDSEAKRIVIPYKVENAVAKRFYAAFGFVEIGVDQASGEMVAELVRPSF
jgi:diamine N-acetyltransferase